jgi:putative DNA primase/helicase
VTLLDTALTWHHTGAAVVPTATDGTKRPGLPGWKQFQTEHPTPNDLATWFTPGRTDGLGLICGAISGNLEMLEFEGRATHLIPELATLMNDNGFADLWARLTTHGYLETTPSGGIHLYYRVDGPAAGNTKLARTPRNGGGVDVLIETRGEGGFTVIAPSAGRTHPTGKPWTTITGTPQMVPTITIDERDALFIIASLLDEMPDIEAVTDNSRNSTPHDPADGLRPGDDYNQRTTWDDILRPAGWTKTKRIGPGYGWTRPDKNPGAGISATTGQNEHDRLYVFTSSTLFDTEQPYTKFAAYTLLEHGGDYAAAAKQLAKDEYGTIATRLQPDHPTAGDLEELVAPTTGDTPWTTPTPTPAPTPSTATTSGTPSSEQNSASGAEQPAEPTPERDAAPNQDNTALLLVDQHQHEIRYCPERGQWLHWNGHHWAWDANGSVAELVRDIARRLPDGEGWANYRKSALSARGVTGTLQMAASDARVVAPIAQLDARPYELNTPAGVVNLRTGKISAPDSRALHTRTTPIGPDPELPTPLWDKFLADTFAGDPELTTYIQRLLGVSLVGTVIEQLLPFLYGSGANGKSVILESTQNVIGLAPTGYAASIPAEMLIARGRDDHPATIAQLSGVRIAISSELEEGVRFAEARIKMLTGGDLINARFMARNPFTFKPTHSMWLHANHLPEVRAGGPAFWRRIKQIPFLHTIPEERQDKTLAERMVKNEGPGILAWMIQGSADYFAHGLPASAAVAAATAAYQHDTDTIAQFVEDRATIGSPAAQHLHIRTSELRNAYEAWCRNEGLESVSARALTQQLRARYGVVQSRSSASRYYDGIRLNELSPQSAESAPDTGELNFDPSDRGGW